jgi:hypothetical protein
VSTPTPAERHLALELIDRAGSATATRPRSNLVTDAALALRALGRAPYHRHPTTVA